MQPRRILSVMAGAIISLALPLAYAQDNKPIRIIVPFTAGSGSDDGSRFYADLISKRLHRTVIVENKPGASGVIAVQTVLNEPADGNTILLGSNSLIAVNPLTVKDISYDPFKDLEPLHGLMISSPAIIVSADSPYKSISDLVATYRENSNPLLVGTYSDGYKLVGKWIEQETDTKVTNVPYKGGSQMVTDLIGGRLDFGLNDQTGILPLLSAGKIRALAITASAREPKMPDIPTMKELGFDGMESYVWSAFSVKHGTPAPIKAELAQAITEVQNSPEGKKFAQQRAGKPLALSLDELGNFQRLEYERFKKIVESADH
ncbi:ABC transporter substrate-binding protein [Advenella sp. S44]|uniref:Bug family tripartite tricarboxylate transporter substrate binding protein n=1 Tax=Advenella sp. S44 TaxID=1982755 RepID=UPI000C2AAE02|nr:tripartite tricarboxylate transporter substrate binding protein [Advenella sp. S44]PJX27693.1 ABC transporter substrate-binding protein [Advenella sp. S44]